MKSVQYIIIIHKYPFINYDKYTTLMYNVINREDWLWDIWKFCELSSEFFYKSKAILKIIKFMFKSARLGHFKSPNQDMLLNCRYFSHYKL